MLVLLPTKYDMKTTARESLLAQPNVIWKRQPESRYSLNQIWYENDSQRVVTRSTKYYMKRTARDSLNHPTFYLSIVHNSTPDTSRVLLQSCRVLRFPYKDMCIGKNNGDSPDIWRLFFRVCVCIYIYIYIRHLGN